MRVSWVLTLGSIFISLLVVPGSLTYFFSDHGPLTGDASLTVGVIALVPGFLMGATGLWVAAQG